MSKEYGLIVPEKNKSSLKSAPVKKPSIFVEESDSEPEDVKPTGFQQILKRQDRVIQEKAVEEDPSVYQYDEIYDEMDQKRKELKLSRKDSDKKPKYINKLLIAADRRKLENERRIERQVQKEREAEGEEYKDKESFVTTAYKKKLEELRELEEQEKREEYLESIGDVRKQGNLDGFYRHLYDQKVNQSEIVKEQEDEESKEETKKKRQSDSENVSSKDKKRRYRKREESKSDDSEEESKKNLTHLPSNLDADSDFSIDSGSEDENLKQQKMNEDPKESDDKSEEQEHVKKSNVVKEVMKADEMKIEEIKEKKLKIDIWKKRTVGRVFEEALQRYFERKALRESG